MSGKAWLALIGGILALVGQFWGGPGAETDLFLPAIGGVLAIIGGIMAMKG
tara:strand:- start:1163 stop:1315 length:153 start_codon:yes stop_codon:yes gene_type:complete